jgi:hypothetical protein
LPQLEMLPSGVAIVTAFSWPCTVTASRHCDPLAVILA